MAERGSARRILDMASGYEPALILEAGVRLGVFDALNDHPMTVAEVAGRTDCSQRGLRVLLNALFGLDLLQRYDGRYALTEESAAYLVSTSPSYQGYMCKHVSRLLLPRWLHLTEAVQTGRPHEAVNQEQEGAAFFREFVEDIFPMSHQAARVFAEQMSAASAAPLSVLDLAAGSGVWGIALAEVLPHVRVTAVDWPAVLPVTRRIAERHGVLDRFQFVAGDLLEVDFGRNHQIATLGHILHSEGEARSRRLLRKTFEAMAPRGTIGIAEFVAHEDRTGPPSALIFAVNMLINTEAGDTFTFSEIAAWLGEAGFVEPRRLDVPGPGTLIVATKPG